MLKGIWRPRIIGARVLAEGGQLPRGFGVAWYLPYSCSFYCLPVPLNRIVAFLRNGYIRLTRAGEDEIAGVYHYANNKGFQAGVEYGAARAQRLNEIVREALSVPPSH